MSINIIFYFVMNTLKSACICISKMRENADKISLLLRDSASSFHWLSSSIFSYCETQRFMDQKLSSPIFALEV